MVGFHHWGRRDFRRDLSGRALAFIDDLAGSPRLQSGTRSGQAIRRFVRGGPAFAFATA
jgi:hypothetical protein